MGCARCHDHKLEPITQKDYYRLQAYLAATEEDNINLAPEAQYKSWEAKTKELKGKIARLQRRARKAEGEEKRRLTDEIEALGDEMPPRPPTIPATRNNFPKRTPIHVLRPASGRTRGSPSARARRASWSPRVSPNSPPTCPTRAPGSPAGWSRPSTR